MRYAKKRALEQARVPPERLRCLARRIHQLGPRPLFELFSELEAGAPLIPRLETYAALPADFIKKLDGDRLPVVRMIRNGRGRA
jgi:hypothetical protein